MARIEHTLVVPQDISVVWKAWSDVRTLPEISRSTAAVRGAPDQLTEVGQTFTQVARAAGKKVEVLWTVTDIAAEDHLTITGEPGFGTSVTMTEKVTAEPGGGTRMVLVIDYHLPFGPVGRLVSKLGLERIANGEACEVLVGVGRLAGRASDSSGSTNHADARS